MAPFLAYATVATVPAGELVVVKFRAPGPLRSFRPHSNTFPLPPDASVFLDIFPLVYSVQRVCGFWAPGCFRWFRPHPKPSHCLLIDEAMAEIEKANPGLKGVLPKDYNRPALDKVMLGELIDLVSGIGMGEPSDKAKDVLGRVYEYFLGGFVPTEYCRTPIAQTAARVAGGSPWSHAHCGA